MKMNKFFKQKYAMSEQGAKNLQKSIFSHTILNLTKMFPPIIGFVFLFQYLGSLEGIPAPVELTLVDYIVIILVMLLVMFLWQGGITYAFTTMSIMKVPTLASI